MSNTYPEWVEESAFGKWFLNTRTWDKRVVRVAINDLTKLIGDNKPLAPTILDIGVGYGASLNHLQAVFQPQKIVALDVDPEVIAQTRHTLTAGNDHIDFHIGNAASLEFNDNDFDIIFCHQTFHHIVDQEQAIREFYRVLRPGGLLLFAESTKKYIHSWIIRWLFRHPMDVQKTAQEYLALITQAGFKVTENKISYPYLWWSRSDLGLGERLLRLPQPARHEREETLINLVASKPPVHPQN